MKRFPVLGLILCLLLSSCGTQSEKKDEKESEHPEVPSEAVTVPEENPLPEMDYQQQAFNLLIRSEFAHEFQSEEASADVVENAVYQRNLAVEEQYNINIQCVPVAGSASMREEFISALRSSVMSDDGAYDLVAGAANYIMAMSAEKLFVNIYDVPYLDLAAPWWSADFTENMTLNQTLFQVTGDIALTTLENMMVLLFNKEIADAHGIEYPYQTVSSGSWTFDKMAAMALQVSEDVNADGKYGKEDLYGYLTYTNSIKTMLVSFDVAYTEPDENHLPKLTYMSDRLMDICDKVSHFVNDNNAVYYHEYETDTLVTTQSMQKMFEQSRALMMAQVLSSVDILRSMDVDFGIIPYPKYDEDQKEYRTAVLENLTVIGIPEGSDIEKSGLIAEAMARESRRLLIPAYYEVALKTKYARDDDSEEMLDIIHQSASYEFGYINSISLSNINELFHSAVLGYGNLASDFKKNKNIYEKALQDLIASYN